MSLELQQSRPSSHVLRNLTTAITVLLVVGLAIGLVAGLALSQGVGRLLDLL